MKTIPREQLTYRFAADIPPVLSIDPGETIVMESFDTTTGRIRKPEDVHEYARVRDPNKVNPAAGPVYVNGAEPGDTLTVEILRIELDEAGSLRINPGALGLLNAEMKAPYCRIVRVEGDQAVFSEEISFPVRPMVGVIATTPATGEITTAVPGDVGSNMDHTIVREGARVYLPVHVKGALFGLGDLHASMGDGEITGNGIEIGGRTTVKVGLIKGKRWPRPWIETDDLWITTGYGWPIDEAIRMAVRDMIALLGEKLGVSREDAYIMISATGDVRMGQSCSGMDATARVEFPRLNEG